MFPKILLSWFFLGGFLFLFLLSHMDKFVNGWMGECVWGMCIHMFVCVCVLLKEVCTLVPDFLFVFLYGGNIPQNCYKYMIFFFFYYPVHAYIYFLLFCNRTVTANIWTLTPLILGPLKTFISCPSTCTASRYWGSFYQNFSLVWC